MKTTEEADPYHLSLPCPGRPRRSRTSGLRPHFYELPPAGHHPQPPVVLKRPLRRISRETLDCYEGRHAPLRLLLWDPTACGGRLRTPSGPLQGDRGRSARRFFLGPSWRAGRGLGASSEGAPRESWVVGRAGKRRRGVARDTATCLEQVLPAAGAS